MEDLKIINIANWNSKVDELGKTYQSNIPFPHIVLDDFLDSKTAHKCEESFPPVDSDNWIHYIHFNERKHGLSKKEFIPEYLFNVIAYLNSKEAISFLENLTGIKGLKADDIIDGGGLHQSENGGFLNVHTDFSVHRKRPNWKRRINLIVYLNKDWHDEYGGHLELWSKDMKSCIQKILPSFNRCVVFNTDQGLYHGHPDPLDCPSDMSRKSIALYYFTEETNTPKNYSTKYSPRPDDGARRIPILIDNHLLHYYHKIRIWFYLEDDFISRILGFFSKKSK